MRKFLLSNSDIKKSIDILTDKVKPEKITTKSLKVIANVLGFDIK